MYRFQSTIFGLLAAICSLQSSVAARALNIATRSTDVTCGGQFPKAGDGFAQRPDGCSSWSGYPQEMRDKWSSANFEGVCDDHERCYYTIGTNVVDCINKFCSGLQTACHNAYCSDLGCDINPLYKPCTADALTYCTAVKSVAAGVYAKAQDLQMRYNTCIAQNGACSNGKPEGATWTEHPDWSLCTTNTYVCRNGKITLTRSYRSPSCREP